MNLNDPMNLMNPMNFRRWLIFNGVGLLGFAVQLGTLAALLGGLRWHYLAATAVAVEAAVLHNFVWHQRVTWRDRDAGGARAVLRRLWHFHLLNGAVSLAGNIGMVAVLAGIIGLHPMAANAGAAAAFSIVNFLGSEMLVFRRAASLGLVLLLAHAAVVPVRAEPEVAAQLRPHTVAAWEKYQKIVDERYRTHIAWSTPFFAHDAFGRETGWRREAMRSTTAMFQADAAGPRAAEIGVPDGKIHHWVGAIFVPGITVDQVLARLQHNAGKEADAYDEVIASRLLERDGDRLRVYMKIQRDATITTVTYNTEHLVVYRRLGDRRASSRSTATRIAELVNAGRPQEREKPPGDDAGYLWRLNAYWRYEQVDGGVLIECESVSLSRSVPLLVRPLVNPIANRLARESLRSTLETLRGVLSRGGDVSGTR